MPKPLYNPWIQSCSLEVLVRFAIYPQNSNILLQLQTYLCNKLSLFNKSMSQTQSVLTIYYICHRVLQYFLRYACSWWLLEELCMRFLVMVFCIYQIQMVPRICVLRDLILVKFGQSTIFFSFHVFSVYIQTIQLLSTC